MTIHKISHRVSWIHTISYLHGNLTRKKSPNFQKTSHNLQAPFFNQTKQPRFPPGITWSHHVLREFRGRWFEYRLTGIAGACRRSHWYVGEVPVGGGKGKVRATMWCCYKDIMAKHKLFFWELHVNPCVYHESCRLFCLAFAYYIPSGSIVLPSIVWKGKGRSWRQDEMKSNNVSDPELISTEDWWLVSVDMFSSQLKTPKKRVEGVSVFGWWTHVWVQPNDMINWINCRFSLGVKCWWSFGSTIILNYFG